MGKVVFFRVTGSKALVPKILEEIPCEIEWTWFRFLKNECGLQIQADNDIVIRTTAGRTNGWSAKLQDIVKDFISKFTYVRKVYTVCLVPSSPKRAKRLSSIRRQNKFQKITHKQIKKLNINKTKKNKYNDSGDDLQLHGHYLNERVTESSPEERKVVVYPATAFVQNKPGLITKERSSTVSTFPRPSKPSISERHRPVHISNTWPEDMYELWNIDCDAEIDEDNTGLGSNDEDETASMYTSISGREEELLHDGITNVEIKPHVIQRLAKNFDNTSLLRIRQELMTLTQNGSWHKMTSRTPRTGHLLQEIFQIYPTAYEY